MAQRQFHLYRSNQIEKLATRMAKLLEHPLPGVFQPETVVVQGRGMSRWLSLELARRNGLCMNQAFVYPRDFIFSILQAWHPDKTGGLINNPGLMSWKIMDSLPSISGQDAFAPISNYLADQDPLKQFQLAEKIASVFDQYLVYRPDILSGWENDPSSHDWQAILWRHLSQNGRHGLPLGQIMKSTDFSSVPSSSETPLPSRICIFGISSLPPLYLDFIYALSSHIPIHLFLLSPSPDSLEDVDTARELEKKRQRESARLGGEFSLPELHLYEINPLLASLGKQGRELFQLLFAKDEIQEHDDFTEPDSDSLLGTLQRHLFHLDDPITDICEVSPQDRSIQIHCCHGPMREVEVLHDQLLDLFQTHPGLHPQDIMVMSPEIEEYAPFIRAVFERPGNDRHKIPYSISDRHPRADNSVVDLFLNILDLPQSRFTSRQAISLLETPILRQRFELNDEDLAAIRRWIQEAGIRWGIDGEHRHRVMGLDFENCSWRQGLDRLLLGYAMRGDNRDVFQGILPYDPIEGDLARLTGRLNLAVETLASMEKRLQQARTLSDWIEELGMILESILPEDESSRAAARPIRQALESLSKTASENVFTGKIDHRIIAYHLENLLVTQATTGGFLMGHVTFCSLKPMRCIPARVICLLGLGDAAFPRQPKRIGFDLIEQNPRPGDRSSRADDRQLFLETILTARQILYLSYSGLSPRENVEAPPSVVVCELLDYLDHIVRFQQPVRAALTTRHRLQPFSPAYFQGKSLFSYSAANLEASRLLAGETAMAASSPSPPLLPPTEEKWMEVELEDLIRFFQNPSKFFMIQRLGIRLRQGEQIVDEKEPFAVSSLARFKIKEEIIDSHLTGKIPPDWSNVSGREVFPVGTSGKHLFEAEKIEARQFWENLREWVKPEKKTSRINLAIGRFTLTGNIHPLHGNRLIQFHCSNTKGKHLVRFWLNHLAASAAASPFEETLCFFEDASHRLPKVKNPETILEQLLEIYWEGLQKPLPFFPNASFAFADCTRRWMQYEKNGKKGRKPGNPLEQARMIWSPAYDANDSSEKNDPYFDFFFGHDDLSDPGFPLYAIKVFDPLLNHQEPLQ